MPVVAVTGAAGGIGYALTVRLAASPKVRKVIAIDGRRGDIAGVTWRVADVRDPAVAGAGRRGRGGARRPGSGAGL